jgi:hypothetical protein
VHTPAYYIKTVTIVVLTFFQTYFLSWLILDYVSKGNFFTFDTAFALLVIFLMVLIAWTFSISVGAWGNGMQYLVVPVPTGMAMFMVLAPQNVTYALITAAVVVAMLMYDVWKSTKLSELLIKFEPTIILKFSTNGLLFLFSVLAGVMVMVNTGKAHELNLGKQTADLVGNTLNTAIQSQIKNTLQGAPQGYLNQVDPSVVSMLEQFGLPTDLSDPAYTDPQNLGIDTKEIVESQVNALIEPYKDFIKPIMALLLFGIFQFYAYIAYLIFSLTVNGIYWIAKKVSFLKTETIQVDKEILKF